MMTIFMHERLGRWPRENRHELKISRANLTHLIYSMEHDQSLDAESTKITSLKERLSTIDHLLQPGTKRAT